MRKLLFVLALLALAGVWAYAALLWPHMPPRIPVHFDLAGRPDRMAPAIQWFVLPVLCTVLTAVFLAIPALARWLARKHPQWVNVPRKEQFLGLAPEARLRVMEPASAFLLGMATLLNALFGYVLHGTYAVASGRSATLNPIGFFLLAPVLILGVVWMTRSLSRRIQREAR